MAKRLWMGCGMAVILLLCQPALVLAQAPAAAREELLDVTDSPIRSAADYYRVAAAAPFGIKPGDTILPIACKIEAYLDSFAGSPSYRDNADIMATLREAIRGARTGDYCVGAVLVNGQGEIVLRAHNTMLTRRRSDLHAEMALLTDFETDTALSARYKRDAFRLQPDMIVYSSAEPCPMCQMRLAMVQVRTRYGMRCPEDSMADRVADLPGFWRRLCEQAPCEPADCSPILRTAACLLFNVFYLDMPQEK